MFESVIVCGQVYLGKQGEHHARKFSFNDILVWKDIFGEGRCELIHQRNGDPAPYPVALVMEDGIPFWYVSNADTAIVGEGKCEIRYLVNDAVVKSNVYTTIVKEALGEGTAEPPEAAKAWVDQVLEAAESVENATAHMPMIGENKNWFVWDQEAQDYIDTGVAAEPELSFVRQSDGSGSVVVNDVADNDTNIAYGFVAGRSNDITLRGFRIVDIDVSGGLHLDSTNGIAVGDIVVYYRKGASGIAKYRDRVESINGNLVTFGDEIKSGITSGKINYVVSADQHYASGSYIIVCKTNKAWDEIGKAGYADRTMIGSTPLTFENGDPVSVFVTGRDNLANIDATVFGNQNDALGTQSFVAGRYNRVFSERGTAFGYQNTVVGHEAFAEGVKNEAVGYASHAEGESVKVEGDHAHGEGYNTMASKRASHAEGYECAATGEDSHAEGHWGKASGSASHAEGWDTNSTGQAAHAEGMSAIASGYVSHAEGENTKAMGAVSHAEGTGTTASEYASHAEGYKTIASGSCAHSEGSQSVASGAQSHAEGINTHAKGWGSHTEGEKTQANEGCAHAEGRSTKANGLYSHAEGANTIADGESAHAEGTGTQAVGDASHAEGKGTIAVRDAVHVQGRYNVADGMGQYAHIVGGGTSDADRKNIHTIDWNGDAWFAGEITFGEDRKSIEDIVREVIAKMDIN